MPAISEPGKELRFTRSAQAGAFWIAAAVLAAAAVTIVASAFYRAENPALPHPAWALLPFALAALALRTAVRLTRHAYLILSPLGIEVFPFFRPASGMRLVSWQEIDSFEFNPDGTVLTIHHDAERTSGIHLSLRPIPAAKRELLRRALDGRTAASACKT